MSSASFPVVLRLILGDQLNVHHHWFDSVDPDVVHVLMEVRQETGYVLHHVQKVAGFFAAMRGFADRLRELGYRVEYIRLDDPDNGQTFASNLARLVRDLGAVRFEFQEPDEYRLDVQLREIAEKLGIPWACVGSDHFLTQRAEVRNFFSGKKRYLMESFYRDMRRRTGLLMRDGGPAGEKWNFDKENRRPYDGSVPVPPSLAFDNDVSAISDMLESAGVRTLGGIEPARLNWPVNRRQSLELLETFVENRLCAFGTFEDAMSREHRVLFHSRLSFALNLKLLSPQEVLDRVVAAWDNGRSGITLSQVEGFVRQVLGWREYMRGMYWAFMPGFGKENFFRHTRRLPEFYWTGQAKMACLAHAVGQSLDFGYAHHIQRLMLTGCFALLWGTDPAEVDRWYLGIYMDGIEWAELPNTRGMSQFADGGRVATKPYVCSARYINRMSDYCSGCDYDWRDGAGARACPFNSLYWHFFQRNEALLRGTGRVGTVYATWDRMAGEVKSGLLKRAERLLESEEL